MMTVADLIEALGGTNEVAQLLSVSPAGVRNWRAFGVIPPRHYKKVKAIGEERSLDIPLDLFDTL